jgi:PD-(D/E)XK nuclease superfamily
VSTGVLRDLSFDEIEANISMTMLDRFARCRRKWMYRYKNGLVPKSMPDYIDIGSAFHAAAAGGYRHWQQTGDSSMFLSGAQFGFDKWYSENPHFAAENHALIGDMVAYWWKQEGSLIANDYSEIVSVEEPLPLYISYFPHNAREEKIIPMRCTPDLLARRRDTGRLVLTDHKTVGTIGDSLNFLPIDFQLRSYAASVWRKYGEIPEVDYNLVRRELPPDFERADGSRPYGLTKSGRPSTRTKNPVDYVQRLRQTYEPAQLEAFEWELHELVTDMAQTWGQGRYPRSIQKSGGFSACPKCDYFSACSRELDGKKLDALTLSFEFTREEKLQEKRAA